LFFSILLISCSEQGSSSNVINSGGRNIGSGATGGETNFYKTIDSTDDVGQDTSIAVDGSNIYISYFDNTNNDLKFAKSTDGGDTWDPASIKTIDSTGDVGEYTSIALNSSNVYISYFDDTNNDLKFTKSTDNGNTWEPGNIKTVDSIGYIGDFISMAVDGLNIYISYHDFGNNDLKFIKSTDGGNTWDSANKRTVDSAGFVGRYTSIAVDGSNVYISYYDDISYDLKFARSTDGGDTWDPVNIKTVDSTGEVGLFTSICVNGSNVYISYYDTTNNDLKFARSTDSGTTWDPANIKTVDSTDRIGAYTSMAIDGSNIYISYYDLTNNNLKFARSTDSGDTWNPGNIKTIYSTDHDGGHTSISVNGSNIYISYYDFTNNDLIFTRSTDKGNTW
jgi:hypothetical protein